MIANTKYDAILIFDTNKFINEDVGDERSFTGGNIGKNVGAVPMLWYDDPRLYASNAFGRMMLNDLNN